MLVDREVPMGGWVYLKMYEDKSFQFKSKGMKGDDDFYSGTFILKNDTIYFKYKNSIPAAGTKAIIEKDYVNYIDGIYPEQVNTKLNKLSNKDY